MLETQPNLSTYKGNLARPTMFSLLYPQRHSSASLFDVEEIIVDRTDPSSVVELDIRRFGIWDGVFARCLVNMFGVIMFLRLPYLVGIAGIGYASLIVIVTR